MTSSDSNSSDVGFIVLIAFVALAFIPLAIGFDSFEELFRIGKIILIVVLVVAVIAGAIFGYLLYKRKIRRRISKKENKSNDNTIPQKLGNETEILAKRNPNENESEKLTW